MRKDDKEKKRTISKEAADREYLCFNGSHTPTLLPVVQRD